MNSSALTNKEIERAWAMHQRGMSWTRIGVVLADERGRAAPYTSNAIYRLVTAWRKARA